MSKQYIVSGPSGAAFIAETGVRQEILTGVFLAETGATTHACTGVLTGASSTIVGTAARTRVHASPGVLTGSGSTLAGTARRTRTHASPGTLAGAASVLAGTASSATVRPSSGALHGAGSTLTGTASSATPRPSSGVLIGAGTTLAGTAVHHAKHTCTSTLVGAGATLVGTAHRTRLHAVSGVLAGAGASLIGASHRTRTHASPGVLTGAGTTIAGVANTGTPRPATGTLVGTGRVVVGAAHRTRTHLITGTPTGASSTITAGKVQHHPGHHKQASGSTFAGSGGLIGQGATLHAVAARTVFRQHVAIGTLTGAATTLSAASHRQHLHPATGALATFGSATVGTSGIIARSTAKEHVVIGSLRGASAIVVGASHRVHTWTATGSIFGEGSILEAVARHNRPHATSGDLAGQIAALLGFSSFGGQKVAAPEERVSHGEGATHELRGRVTRGVAEAQARHKLVELRSSVPINDT